MAKCDDDIRCAEISDCKQKDDDCSPPADRIELVLLMPGHGDPKSMTLHCNEILSANDSFVNGQTTPVDQMDQRETELKRNMWWRCFDQCCGIKSYSMKKTEKESIESEIVCLQMLQESPKVKLILNFGLVVVCSIGIFMFIYFSL